MSEARGIILPSLCCRKNNAAPPQHEQLVQLVQHELKPTSEQVCLQPKTFLWPQQQELITTLQPMCLLLQHPHPPPPPPGAGGAGGCSNRQRQHIVTQLAHVERFSQENTHTQKNKTTPTKIILLSISHGNSCFGFVNGSSQTIACGPLSYSRCIASVQNLLQSDSTGSEIKGRMGWDGWRGGTRRGCVCVFIPPYSNTSQSAALIHLSQTFVVQL